LIEQSGNHLNEFTVTELAQSAVNYPVDQSRRVRHRHAHVQPFARDRIRRTLAHLTGHLLGAQLIRSARRRIDDQAARERISLRH
jgi:hypothetical protein